MTNLMCNPLAITARPGRVANDESMPVVLNEIRYELSMDPAKTKKQVKQRMYEFSAAQNHLSKALETTPERLTVRMVAENESTFLECLDRCSFSKAKKQALRTARNSVLAHARNLGISPASFMLQVEWEPIVAVLPTDHGVTAIACDAIRRKRRPMDFSDADLSVWANAMLDAGRDYSYVRQAKSAFLAAIRRAGLQSSLPLLDLSVRRLPGYRLRIGEMPETVRSKIMQTVDCRHEEIGISEETQREIIENFEYFFGYAHRVCGMDIGEFQLVLNEPFVKQYAFWLHNVRKCTRATVVGRLSRMFAALEASPDLADRDYSFIRGIYRKLRREPHSALEERRRQRHLAFQDLAAIPGRMRAERETLLDESPRSLGWRLHDELLLSCLILAQYPPRFVRKAVLGRNIFKAAIPKSGPPFQMPAWAKDLVCQDPNVEFWQFSYESTQQRLFRGLILQQIVPLLEQYLYYRPLLIGREEDTGTLFLNRAGRPLTCYRLGQHVNDLTRRYTGKCVSPKTIQSSFALRWREMKGPDGDAMLSTIQWVQYPTIKMRYDEEFRKQRLARVIRRKERYS